MDIDQFLAMPKVAIASHDAGGAEILSALYLQQPQWQARLLIDGPALKVFQRKTGHVNYFSPSDVHKVISEADWVLTGSGWQSTLEWEAIKQARALGKPVITFLDHWVNYRPRFERDGELCLPDQIWVGDSDALRIASQEFPNLPIKLLDNPYFAEIAAGFCNSGREAGLDAENKAHGAHLLFVCEPIADHAANQFGDARYWGYTEFDALDFFLQNIGKVAPVVRNIVIRPHPAEAHGKYDALLQQYDLPLSIGGKCDLQEEIAHADVVLGCNSMALVIAMLAKRKVFCCIPPGGPVCTLPQKQIVMLRDQM